MAAGMAARALCQLFDDDASGAHAAAQQQQQAAAAAVNPYGHNAYGHHAYGNTQEPPSPSQLPSQLPSGWNGLAGEASPSQRAQLPPQLNSPPSPMLNSPQQGPQDDYGASRLAAWERMVANASGQGGGNDAYAAAYGGASPNASSGLAGSPALAGLPGGQQSPNHSVLNDALQALERSKELGGAARQARDAPGAGAAPSAAAS